MKGTKVLVYKKFIMMICAFLFISFIAIGSEKERIKNEIYNQKKVSQSEDKKSINNEIQTIIIQLPGLPKDAKKLEMILIQPGTFTMGAPMDERGRRDEHDWPPHKVTITQPFYIGKYEVTQAQWEAVMGSNSHHSKFPGKNHPVEKVSWRNCQKFIKRMNVLGQGIFRLPTEAEWEYACRAGTENRYFFGDALECAETGIEYCEIADKYMWWSGNNKPEGTREVGLKLPNPWGLYDMHGNVSEWCSDLWKTPYDRGSKIDPEGPASNWFKRLYPLSNHVNRGGSIYYGRNFHGVNDCSSASRFYEQAIDFHYSLGFRLVREYP